MTTMTEERAEFLADIITTALEGGIGYWATATHYRWADDPPFAEADIFDRESDLICSVCQQPWADARTITQQLMRQSWVMVHVDDQGNEIDSDHEPEPVTMHVGMADIERALALINDPNTNIPHAHPSWRAAVTEASTLNDAGELDSIDADQIVQIACFNEIVYG